MKKKVLLILSMVFVFALVLAFSVSAAEWTYEDESGTVYLTLTIDDSTKVVTEYDGRFPMWDEDNNPLTWYVIKTDTTNNVKTVKSFVSTDTAYTNHGDGYFRFIQEANFNVDGYPVPTKENVVSMNMPNDKGITAFSDYNAVNFQAGVKYTPDKLELLFLRCPNTMTNTTRLAQASKILEVEFDENSIFTELSHLSFHESRSLRKISIPASVEKILSQSDSDGRAFYNCVSLEQITFDEGSNLQIIQGGAFKGCSSLKEIQFPASMVTVDNNVLSNISGLEIVRLSENFTHFINTDGNGNVRSDHHSFTYNSPNIKEYYLPVTFYATAPTTTYQVSYAFDGASANCKFFYCGTVDEFATAKENFLTQTSASKNNGNFLNATVITYTEYLENPEAYAEGRYVVCEYNTCVAFYSSNHIGEKKMVYGDNMYFENANICTVCTRCNDTAVEKELSPLFKSLGYSYSSNAIMQSFGVNYDVLAEYQKFYSGTEISFGLIAVAFANAEDGKLLDAEKKAQVDLTNKEYDIFEMKITGIGSENQATSLFLCGYITLGDKTYYLSVGKCNESALDFATSYESVSASGATKIE